MVLRPPAPGIPLYRNGATSATDRARRNHGMRPGGQGQRPVSYSCTGRCRIVSVTMAIDCSSNDTWDIPTAITTRASAAIATAAGGSWSALDCSCAELGSVELVDGRAPERRDASDGVAQF